MSAKGSSSQVIQPNQYIAPQDLNILLKGTMYQEELAKNNLQELKSSYNQLASLPAFGKDAEVLQGRLEELKNQVSGMKLGSLNDFNTKAQINGIINEFGKDKKLNDIAKRWTPYVQELKKKEKADAEGKLYISPLLDDAQEYIQNNESIEGKRFGSSGWIAADFDKELEGALKNVQKVKKVIKVGNYNQEVESYDDNDLQTTLKSFYERPDIDRDIQYKINKAAKNQNIDWSEKGAFTLQKQLNDANNLLLIDPTSTEARRFIETNAQFLEQPEKLAQIARNQYVSEEKNKEIASKIAAKQYESYGKLEADAFKLKAVDHYNKMVEKQAEDLSLGASMMNKTLAEVMRDPNLLSKAATLTQQAKLAEFSQKENIKLENKIAAKNSAVNGGFDKFTDSQTVSYKDNSGKDVDIQYGEFKRLVKTADAKTVKKMVASVMNQKNANDPNWQPLTEDQVSILKKGDDRQIKIRGFYGFNQDALPIDDVLNLNNFSGDNPKTDKSETPNSSSNITYNKVALEQKGYSKEVIQKAIEALVAAKADTTDANIEHVIKQNK